MSSRLRIKTQVPRLIPLLMSWVMKCRGCQPTFFLVQASFLTRQNGTRVAVKVLKGRRAASSATQEANLLPVRPHAHLTSTYAVVTPATTYGFALVTWANKEDHELREALLPLESLPSMFTLPQEDLACPSLADDEEEERDGPLWAWVVNELCTPRTLLTLINDTSVTIHDRDKVRYIREIASGLSYLHSQGIVHRDVKPANALLHSDGHLRLADFGCSSRPGQDEVAVIGTVPYQAPEVLRGGMGCERSDVFSLGITTWHLVTRHSPYEGLHHHVVLYQVTCLHQRPQDHRAYDHPDPSSLSQTEDLLFRLAGKCWAEEPQDRPDAASLCRLLSALLCSPTI